MNFIVESDRGVNEMSVQARDNSRFRQVIGASGLSTPLVMAGLALIVILIASIAGMSVDANPLEIGGPPYP
jgi:hypothetical protein